MLVNQQVDEADRLTLQTPQKEELIVRPYDEADFQSIQEMERSVYPPPWPQDDLWSIDQLKSHVDVFSEGALCAEYDEDIVGTMTTLIVDELPDAQHTWEDITDHGYLSSSHNDLGDTLYVADLQVDPTYRELGIGKKLMRESYDLVRRLGLRRLVGAVRMPGYYKHEERLTPEEYVQEVLTGDLKDPVINFMLHCGRKPIKVVKDYLHDIKSGNNALLMEWRNPDFN
ncbi:GNAT family N-acetyltransferase [Aneurinibacillus migulanus]|uniref:Acetyltransferase (GNAT) family protein n=1 Tax=Aneurinibacillus migulanus TaxID=47500 RepID=A0A1G8HEC1_ANEMI|nr:GNAT family N-acetyltransferase [Aneurinibacillus migulanus]MCP1354299.1 GNAT family N-acetyltransferase [Aneurinibacillus migulanus]MED0891393.1 GNAT family N-acetyltransferase [Aneurinibacillus migulanus]MED1613918.1 GNAT family N-acetyltransferase [Aneurinibacillus migulanus]MED4728801.1 GNAT family N-acetyltransferase [Aneurinibacillus migulanus]SDI04983.1 Acetyltransferase (GNAT) family protein [Aneurinibacillus migulanus]